MTLLNKPSASTIRSQRYRKQHRRFDYVPASDVLAIIEIYLAKYPDQPICATLDAIVRTAHKHVQNKNNNVYCNAQVS